jgi:hypothetical protein
VEHPRPSEEEIQDKLFFEILPKRYPDSVIVKNWMGWSYRGKEDRKEQTRFFREFDIALFERKTQAGMHSLVLTGFEIKGFGEKSGKLPAFAQGLDQALALLHQGADYAYLLHPEPAERDKKDLKDLCEKFAPYVGLVFVPHDLEKLAPYYQPYKDAQRNPHSMADRKRNMLTSLATWGLRDAISELPLWCKRQEY